jgi:hypothetical protein
VRSDDPSSDAISFQFLKVCLSSEASCSGRKRSPLSVPRRIVTTGPIHDRKDALLANADKLHPLGRGNKPLPDIHPRERRKSCYENVIYGHIVQKLGQDELSAASRFRIRADSQTRDGKCRPRWRPTSPPCTTSRARGPWSSRFMCRSRARPVVSVPSAAVAPWLALQPTGPC